MRRTSTFRRRDYDCTHRFTTDLTGHRSDAGLQLAGKARPAARLARRGRHRPALLEAGLHDLRCVGARRLPRGHRHARHYPRRHPHYEHAQALRRRHRHPARVQQREPRPPHPGDHRGLRVRGLHRRRRRLRHARRARRPAAHQPRLPAALRRHRRADLQQRARRLRRRRHPDQHRPRRHRAGRRGPRRRLRGLPHGADQVLCHQPGHVRAVHRVLRRVRHVQDVRQEQVRKGGLCRPALRALHRRCVRRGVPRARVLLRP